MFFDECRKMRHHRIPPDPEFGPPVGSFMSKGECLVMMHHLAAQEFLSWTTLISLHEVQGFELSND